MIPLNISTDREVPSVKKELSFIALGIIAAAPAFASQQSTSQGFIEDSHLELFLRNAYTRHTSSCMCVGNNSAYPWASPLRGQRKRCSKRLAVLSGNSKYLGYIPNVIIAMGCRIKPNGARGLSPPSNRALPRDRSALAWTVSPSMRCALTAVAGPAVGALINPLYRTAQGVTGVIRPFSPPGCTASPAPGSPPPER